MSKARSTNLMDPNAGVPKETSLANTIAEAQVAQIQGMMTIAKRFPRDQDMAINKIKQACSRPTLAEDAQYEYQRGTEIVKGPSIRLAEVLMQCWGNIDSGVIELVRDTEAGESLCQAYAVELETNVRQQMMFTVRHWRDTKSGGYRLKADRDIYEMVMNQGARRQRACLLKVIPGDITEMAINACEDTISAVNNKTPIAARVKAMTDAFEKTYGVTSSQLEAKVGHNIGSFSHQTCNRLQRVYRALQNGMTTVEQEFPSGDEGKSTADKKGDALADMADQMLGGEQQTAPTLEQLLDLIAGARTITELNAITEEHVLSRPETDTLREQLIDACNRREQWIQANQDDQQPARGKRR